MTYNPLNTANSYATHKLFSEHLYPEAPWHLGTKESYSFRNSDIICTHVGNRTGLPDHARSYKYRVKGERFSASILAVWIEATAKISIENLSDPLTFNCWLRNEDLEDSLALAETANKLASWYRSCASSTYRRELTGVA